MSNAARKARKRSGETFQHPVKEATPITKRQSFQRLDAGDQGKIAEARGITLTKREREVLKNKRPPKPIRQQRNYSM